MVTLDEAMALRDTIEKERAARGTSGRPFAYYVRPHSPDAAEVDRFFAAGFENLVLWGPHVWPNTPELSLEEKIAGLERVARELGLSAAV
jgi:hypothetical protein